MGQANLNLAYQDFLRQEGYPKEQINFLANVLQGVRLPQTTIEQTTEMPAMPGSASGLEKAITGATGIQELLDKYRKYFPSSSGGADATDYGALADWLNSQRGG
jgi:hypothetical protein